MRDSTSPRWRTAVLWMVAMSVAACGSPGRRDAETIPSAKLDSEPPPSLDGCRWKKTLFDGKVDASCPGFRLAVSEAPAELRSADVAEFLEMYAQQNFPSGTPSKIEIQIDERTIDGLFHAPEHHFIAAGPKSADDEHIRGVACIAEGQEQEGTCRAVLEGLFAGTLRVPDVTAEETPTLAGQPLKVPEGCRATAESIRCEGDQLTQMSWEEVPEAALQERYRQHVERIAAAFRGATTTDAPQEAACTLTDGTGANACTYLHASEGSDHVHAYVASGTIRNRSIVLICTFQNRPKDDLGELCAQAIARPRAP